MPNLPAHATKTIARLPYTLPSGKEITVTQDASTTADSTGRTIWLGGQVLSVYLHDLLGRPSKKGGRRPRAIELGAGPGLVSLTLLDLGYDVLATDLPVIVDGVLQRNVKENADKRNENGGRIERRVLDWFQQPDEWTWRSENDPEAALEPPFDLIVTADTVYDPALSEPLLRTLHGLASLSPSAPIYLALERRDPALVSSFLSSAAADWSLKPSRVDHARLLKLVSSREGTLAWEDESEWDGVEVWKLKLSRKARAGKS
ncbi:hypothetical protein JCM10207_000996 [Rhodosporidiobolus poonsookiae]